MAIARAVVGGPSILLADEPTGNLDPDLALGILDLLARIVRLGTTVIIATHDPLVVQNAACNRAIFMDQGEVVEDKQLKGPRRVQAAPTNLQELLGDKEEDPEEPPGEGTGRGMSSIA